jgi:hypothetical protein
LKEVQPESVARIAPDVIVDYFSRVSVEGKLADWQFRQMVDAIPLLVVDLAGAPAGG